MVATLCVAIGGAIGSVARYWLGIIFFSLNKNLPWGTIIINISGSFIISFVGALTFFSGRFPLSENMRLLILVGFCGGFTTFSTFSVQSFELLREGALMRAFINIILSVILCLSATAIGFYSAQKINSGKTIMEQIQDKNSTK